jgi:predicted Zn-dependent protease with MMP-like domain/Flp pilus assembly protein TadD
MGRAPASAGEEAERLLEQAANAFEDGDPDRALELAESACAAAPRSVPALHYRAAALAELERLEEAREAYEAALSRGGDDLDLLLDAADFYVNRLQPPEADREWLERGLELARRGSQLARRQRDEELGAEVGLVEAVALNQLGLSQAALARLEQVLAARPRDLDAQLERAFALYELCRFDDAARQLDDVLRLEPDQAWAHHYLGLVAERRRDARQAEKCFARARKLSPQDFPRPVSLSSEAFDAAVEDALASLPEGVRRYLANVAIAVEDIPSDDDLTASDPPLSPSILGVFRGSPYGDKSSMDPWSHFPSSIVLYQKNLERFARDKKELAEQIGITLIHEVGHFLGLDEEDLWERGLE